MFWFGQSTRAQQAQKEIKHLMTQRNEYVKKIEYLEKTLDNAELRLKTYDGSLEPNPWLEIEEKVKAGWVAPYCVWSTAYFNSGDVISHTDNSIFSAPMSQSGQGKDSALNIADTNLVNSSVSFPFDSTLCSVQCELMGGTEEDARMIHDYGVLQLVFLQYTQPVSPLGVFSWDAENRSGMHVLQGLPDSRAEPTVTRNQSFHAMLSFGQTTRHCLQEDIRVRITLALALTRS